MKILYSDDSSTTMVLLESKKEGQQLVEITAAALLGKPLSKKSLAYKLAKKIDDDLPVF